MMKKLLPKDWGWFDPHKNGIKIWIDKDTYLFLSNENKRYLQNQLNSKLGILV